MKTLSNLLLIIVIVGGSILACKKDAVDPAADCSTTQNRDMEGFFNTLNSSSTYFIYENMDLATHEYNFTTSVDLQICGFGYISQDPNLNYEIKITDSNNNTVYSGTFSFDNSAYDYVGIPPLTLSAGTYTLSRTVINPSSPNDALGPITRRSDFMDMDFPKTLGNITFNSSKFYGGGGPVLDYGIPNIYFEYIEL